MTEHDRLLNQLRNIASWPALREENRDMVESGLTKGRVKLLSFMDLSVRVSACVCVTWETESTRAVLLPGRRDEF